MELYLHSNNFTGGLDSIFAKQGEEYFILDLSDNMFAGPIDEDIGSLDRSIQKSLGKLPRLETLKLEKNGLIGKIPSELSNATWLKSIVLSNNNLTGGIPSSVINKEWRLEVFDVSHNMLTGEIPPHNATIPAASFEGNSGLCGSPLPPCNAA
ncbi:hypothetical protein MKW94_028793 [Papaver nudicaule]|uniref:Uncharacterized protein n=1 Tax=Papaver nudicaule TaxID=74823 RepID=A0AA41VW06_PAPNU|nr:hypothetical protein [Papaver nudicaule]